MVTSSKIRTEALCLYSVLAAFLLVAVLSIYTTSSDTLFLITFFVVSFVIGLAVAGRSPNQEGIFVLLVSMLILRLIVPLSKPGMILDNQPDTYSERQSLLFLLNNHVTLTAPPTTILTDTTGTTGYFANYPGVSLLLASLQIVSGIDPNILLKYLPILLVLPVFGAIPLCVRALGIHNDRAELIATAIVVTNSQVSMGTMYSAPASYGTILFVIGLAFFLDSISARRPQSVLCFVTVACALVIYHMTSSVFLIGVASLLSLILCIPQLRRRSQVHLGATMILLFMIIGCVWWSVYVASGTISFLSQFIVQIFSHAPVVSLRSGVLLPQSGVDKPLWMLSIEYLAYGLFGVAVLVSLFTRAKDVFLAKLLTLVGSLLALVFGSIWFLGFQLAADMFYRSFFLLMVGAAPLVGAQFGKTMDGLSNTFSQRVSWCKIRNFVTVSLITLLVLNSVFFAMPRFFYDYSTPLQSEDTRYNLEKWQTLGVFYSSHVDRNQVTFGPRLGQALVGGYSGTPYVSFAFFGSPIRIPASSFPYLPRVLRNDYVVISWAMQTAPAVPGYYPDIITPARISTRVYDNGEVILLIMIAPDAVVPS